MRADPQSSRAARGVERPAVLPEPRPPHLVLEEVGGAPGYALWRLLNDCGLWIAVEDRAALFAPQPREDAPDGWPGELDDALAVLRAASAAPELARAGDLAGAAAAVWEWAERQGHLEAALQFAELAARLEPDSSARAGTAGRLCRRRGGLHPRATRWFLRAARLARLRGDEIAFATAHLGWGALEFNHGSYLHADAHFIKACRRAMRVGRHSTAALARHNLMAVAIMTERHEDALRHALEAVRLYAAHHPRFPVLAHDVAYGIAAQGFYSSALPLLVRTLPLVAHLRERILVLATLCRAAGAVRDRVRFERAAAELLRMADDRAEMADTSLYHAAQGARSFEQWERADVLARRSLGLGEASGNRWVVREARALIASVARREPGDVDVVPEEGGVIDHVVELLLSRLGKHTAPPDGRAVPVERFPVY